jgi:Domain of unknown function (DUF4136)
MLRATVIGAAVLASVLAVGCAGTRRAAEMQVRVEYEPGADFVQWKIFRIASEPSGPREASSYPHLERMVREALVAELEARGYQHASDGGTDFRVSFDLAFSGTSMRDGLDGTHGVDTGPAESTRGKPIATLIVRMLHPGTSQVLWQGELGGVEIDAVNPEATLRKAVWRVLVEFPPLSG